MPLPQESWQRGAHSCQLSQEYRETTTALPHQTQPHSPQTEKTLLASLAMPSTPKPSIRLGAASLSLQRAGVGCSRAGDPGHCYGPSLFLPHAHLLPQLAFLKFHLPPVPPILLNTKPAGRCVNRGYPGVLLSRKQRVKWCLKLCEPQARSPGLPEPDSCTWRYRRCKWGCKSGPLVHPEIGCNRNRGEALL